MGGSSVTAGYRYYLGALFGICVGPVDAITKIQVDDRTAWEGEVTGNTDIDVDAPELFGGDASEGGVSGVVEVRMGGADQLAPAYIEQKSGQLHPAYRNMLTLVFRGRSQGEIVTAGLNNTPFTSAFYGGVTTAPYVGRTGFYWAALNPYIKAVSVYVRSILAGWTTAVWYPEKAVINGTQMNPAHIIYRILTDRDWGLGRDLSLIDDVKFRAAADTLYAEGFGLSFEWSEQSDGEQLTLELLEHIDGALDTDFKTGKYVLKLIRDDYDPDTLVVFDGSNILSMEEFEKPGWGETINEVVVSYTNTDTNQLEPVAVQDLANLQIQGSVSSQSKTYAGVRDPQLGYRLAQRDLRVLSSPLTKMQFISNRVGFDLYKGDVVRISWAPKKVVNMVCRIVDIDRGQLEDGKMTFSVIEDVFHLPDTSYGIGQDSTWVNPSAQPAENAVAVVTEVPYYVMHQLLGDESVGKLTGAESYPLIMVEKPSQQNSRFTLYTSVAPSFTPAVKWSNADYTPTALLNGAVAWDQTVFAYDAVVGDVLNLAGGFLLLEEEWISIVSIDASNITVKRGCLDSIPAAHADNLRMWFYSDGVNETGYNGVDQDSVLGETDYYRETGRSFSGETSFTTAPQQTYVHGAKWANPYPPANVKFDGNYFPASVQGNFTITWAGRNRDQQIVGLVGWTEDNINPPGDVTYTLKIYDDDTDVLLYVVRFLRVTSGVGGTYTYPGGGTTTHYRLEFFAIDAANRESAHVVHTCEAIGNADIGVQPVSPDQSTVTFTFDGTFASDEGVQTSVSFQPEHGNAVALNQIQTGAGKASITDYAIELKALGDAAFDPAAVTITRTGNNVEFKTIAGSLVGFAKVDAVESRVDVRQEPLGATSELPQLVSIDLYTTANGTVIEAPNNSSKYSGGGVAIVPLRISGLTYDISKAINFGVQAAVAYNVVQSATSSLDALLGLDTAISTAQFLKPYVSSAGNSYDPAVQDRPSVTLAMKPGYAVAETWASPNLWGTHPSGYGLGIKQKLAGRVGWPSGAKKKVAVSFDTQYGTIAGSSGPISHMAVGQVYTITIDGTDHSHTVDSSDVAGDPYHDLIFNDLKAQIDALGTYTTTLEQFTSADGVLHTGSLILENNTANADFSIVATSTYGLIVTVVRA